MLIAQLFLPAVQAYGWLYQAITQNVAKYATIRACIVVKEGGAELSETRDEQPCTCGMHCMLSAMHAERMDSSNKQVQLCNSCGHETVKLI